MWPWLIPAMLGAGLGAATNKDKAKGALTGGLLGGVGGAFAPSRLGASGATNPALIESAVGTAGYGPSSASMGILGDVTKYAGPAANVLGAASSAQNLFGGQQPMAPPAQLGATGDPIGSLLNNQQQEEMMRKQLMEKLQRRMYGGTL